MSYELKELVFDEGFVEKINIAFADLRADYELELDESKEQIEKLKAVHIDIGNNLSNLVSYSIVSSGKNIRFERNRKNTSFFNGKKPD